MFLALLAACTPTSTPCEGTDCADIETVQAEQLESLSVQQDACYDDTCGGVIASGAMAVSGSAQDYTLTVDAVSFSLHTPGRIDASTWAGREVDVRFGGDFQGHTAVALSDASGPFYIAEPTYGGLVTPSIFNRDLVAYGEPVADSFVDTDDYEITFRSAVVTADDGAHTVMPGEVSFLTIDGVTWRFVLISAYTADTIEGGEYTDCGGRQDILAFEMERVDAAGTPDTLVRPDGMDYAKASCG